jgi:membrane protease YdiL (CAAX protease family)
MYCRPCYSPRSSGNWVSTPGAPAFIFPFAIVQAIIFTRTKSLSYIVAVHLLFDFVLFLVLLDAHNRAWFEVFIY